MEMTRQTLDSKNPRSSSLVPKHAAIAPDFASWLTSDLRVKGTSVPPEAAPALLSEPPRAAAGPAPEQVALARWLTADLRPRGSTPPDSLAPQMVAAPIPLALVPAADLEAEDLAVLPTRSGTRSRAQARRRAAVAFALLLLGGGVVLFGRAGSHGDVAAEPAAAAAPQGLLTALPPPPPDSVLPEVAPPPAEPVERRRSGPVPEGDAPEASDLAERAGGVSVARFPDLPLPTQSQLARDERERAKARDDAARRAAKRADP
jgi:hypothetical protein